MLLKDDVYGALWAETKASASKYWAMKNESNPLWYLSTTRNSSQTHMETYTTGCRTIKPMDDDEDRWRWRLTRPSRSLLPSLYPSLHFSFPFFPSLPFHLTSPPSLSALSFFLSFLLRFKIFMILFCLFYPTSPYHSTSLPYTISYSCARRTWATSGGHHSQG